MREPKYLTTKELQESLSRIEEVAEYIKRVEKENEHFHQEFCKEFRELIQKTNTAASDLRKEFDDLRKKYNKAKKIFSGE